MSIKWHIKLSMRQQQSQSKRRRHIELIRAFSHTRTRHTRMYTCTGCALSERELPATKRLKVFCPTVAQTVCIHIAKARKAEE